MKIVIIGAGVAGCIMARALAACPQFEVICLERVEASDHSESGTGLNVGPNAMLALRRHSAPLHAAVLARSYPWQSWRISLTGGTVLFDLPLSKVASNDGIRIRWSELYAALRGEAAGLIRYSAQVSHLGYMDGGTEGLFVEYAVNGVAQRIDDIDLLIAADGRYSLARTLLAGVPLMRQHGVVIYRLLVPDTSDGLIDDYEQWFNGPNRLLAFRVPGNAIYLAGTFPIAPGGDIPEAAKDAAYLRALYTPASGAPSPQCRWLIDTICANVPAIHWARLQESPPLFRDDKGHVLFLGDASHGMVPTLGQGATQAVEDACVAADLLLKRIAAGGARGRAVPDMRPEVLPGVLREFESLRAERVRFVMDFSREASDTLAAGSDPVAGAQQKLEAPFQRKLERLYRDVPQVV